MNPTKETKHEDAFGSNAADVRDIGNGLVDQHSSVGREGDGGSLPVGDNQSVDDERMGVAGSPADIPGHQQLGAMRRFDNDDIPWVKPLSPPLKPLGPILKTLNFPRLNGSALNAALTVLLDQEEFERERKERTRRRKTQFGER